MQSVTVVEKTMAEKILDIKNLDITFKTTAGVVHAIRGINIDLEKGETVAVVGESGSGKSVTMKAAMGILASNAVVNSGTIEFTYHQRRRRWTFYRRIKNGSAAISTASGFRWCFRIR